MEQRFRTMKKKGRLFFITTGLADFVDRRI